MCSTGTGGTAGQDLAALGQVTAQLAGVLVVDSGHLVNAESTNLLALTGTHTLFVLKLPFTSLSSSASFFFSSAVSVVLSFSSNSFFMFFPYNIKYTPQLLAEGI